MKSILIKYDIKEDILYIYFSKNRPAITIELEDDILLRIDPNTQEIISLEFLFFSKNKIKFELGKTDKEAIKKVEKYSRVNKKIFNKEKKNKHKSSSFDPSVLNNHSDNYNNSP